MNAILIRNVKKYKSKTIIVINFLKLIIKFVKMLLIIVNIMKLHMVAHKHMKNNVNKKV